MRGVALRGLPVIGDDERTLAVTKPIFDGLYEFYRRATLLGREPAGHRSARPPPARWLPGRIVGRQAASSSAPSSPTTGCPLTAHTRQITPHTTAFIVPV